MEQKKQFGVIFFLIDRERIEKVGHFYRKLRYSQMHSNPGATLKIPVSFNQIQRIVYFQDWSYQIDNFQ